MFMPQPQHQVAHNLRKPMHHPNLAQALNNYSSPKFLQQQMQVPYTMNSFHGPKVGTVAQSNGSLTQLLQNSNALNQHKQSPNQMFKKRPFRTNISK